MTAAAVREGLPKPEILRSSDFFAPDFPFALRRVVNSASEYHCGRRFKREFWKLTYVIDGSGDLLIDELRYPIRAGSMLLIHPGAVTGYDIASGRLELYNLVFDRAMLGSAGGELADRQPFFAVFSDSFRQRDRLPLYVADGAPGAEALFQALEEEYFSNRPARKVMLKLKLVELLILMLRSRPGAPGDAGELIGRVRYRLETGCADSLSTGRLAVEFGVSADRLARLYKRATGRTVTADLKALRLERAAELLRGGSRVEEACYRSGFNDLSYFYRAFSTRFGLTPGAWRSGAASSPKKERDLQS